MYVDLHRRKPPVSRAMIRDHCSLVSWQQETVFGFCVTFWHRPKEELFVIAEAAETLVSAIDNARYMYQWQEPSHDDEPFEITVPLLISVFVPRPFSQNQSCEG